ncbi:MAG: DUF4286 family protein [Muribaculaceae bacterium]|nr:DUF4286 family protein [Muribaculaceae bacterium]
MILLNTTFHVEKSIEKDFINWVKTTYIPVALSSGIVKDALFTRILAESEGGTAYAVQFKSIDIATAEQWHDTDAQKLKSDISQRWGQRILYFSTYMDIID